MTEQLAGIDAFDSWASAADAVRGTTKRLQKLAALVDYLPSLPDDALAIAARFFSGIVFPRHDARTTQVGGSILWTALASLTGLPDETLAEAYGRTATRETWWGRARAAAAVRPYARLDRGALSPARASHRLDGSARDRTRDSARCSAPTRRGTSPSSSAASCASASRRRRWRKRSRVRSSDHSSRCAMRTGFEATSARWPSSHDTASLASARLALFHPIGFMLAQPLATPEEIVEVMPSPFAIEDKYDGIRAQAHVDGDEVRLFSRTLDDITRGYPEVVASLRGSASGLFSTVSSSPSRRMTGAGRDPSPCFSADSGGSRPARPCCRRPRWLCRVRSPRDQSRAGARRKLRGASVSSSGRYRWPGESAFVASNVSAYSAQDVGVGVLPELGRPGTKD